MDRRTLFKRAAGGTGAIAATFLPKEGRASQLLFALRSRADSGTKLDAQRAAKSRLLAKAVIEKGQIPGVVKYEATLDNTMGRSQDVKAEIHHDGAIYKVTIVNADNPPNEGDYMKFAVKRKGAKAFMDTSDMGLDGRCDYAQFPPGTIGNTVEHIYAPPVRGKKHQKRAQGQHDTTIDTLLKFYDVKTI